jgi:plastocyanin
MTFSTPWMRIGCIIIFGSVFLWPPSIGAYEVDPAVSGATVHGRVAFTGPLPRPEALPVHRDSKFCGETMPNEALVVDTATRGLMSVLITIEGVERGKPTNPQSMELTLGFQNKTCRFFPRATAAVVASTLEIQNNDPILHNTHVRKENRFGPTVLNVAQPAGTKPIRKTLRETGLLDIRCDAHPFMHSMVLVSEHPYFAVTDSAGAFAITQVPPGTYRLRLWHETLGSREKVITVPTAGSLSVELEVARED